MSQLNETNSTDILPDNSNNFKVDPPIFYRQIPAPNPYSTLVKWGAHHLFDVSLGNSIIYNVFPLIDYYSNIEKNISISGLDFDYIAITSSSIIRFDKDTRMIKEISNEAYCVALYVPIQDIIVAVSATSSHFVLIQPTDLKHPIETEFHNHQFPLFHMAFFRNSKVLLTTGNEIKIWKFDFSLPSRNITIIKPSINIKLQSTIEIDTEFNYINSPCFDYYNEYIIIPKSSGFVAYNVDGTIVKQISRLPITSPISASFLPNDHPKTTKNKINQLYQPFIPNPKNDKTKSKEEILNEEDNSVFITAESENGICEWTPKGTIKKRHISGNSTIISIRLINKDFFLYLDSKNNIYIVDMRSSRLFLVATTKEKPISMTLFKTSSLSYSLQYYLAVCINTSVSLYQIVIPWKVFAPAIVKPKMIKLYPQKNNASRLLIQTYNSDISLVSPKTGQVITSACPENPKSLLSSFYDRGMLITEPRDQLFVVNENGHILCYETNSIPCELITSFDIHAVNVFIVVNQFNDDFDYQTETTDSLISNSPSSMNSKPLSTCPNSRLMVDPLNLNYCVVTQNGEIILCDYDTFQFKKRFIVQIGEVNAAYFESDYGTIIMLYKDCVIRFDINTGKILNKLNDTQYGCISAVGKSLCLIGYESGKMLMIQIKQNKLELIKNEHNTYHTSTLTGFTFGRNYFLSASADQTIRTFSLNGTPVFVIKLPLPIYGVEILNGKRDIIVGTDKELMIIEGRHIFLDDFEGKIDEIDNYNEKDDFLNDQIRSPLKEEEIKKRNFLTMRKSDEPVKEKKVQIDQISINKPKKKVIDEKTRKKILEEMMKLGSDGVLAARIEERERKRIEEQKRKIEYEYNMEKQLKKIEDEKETKKNLIKEETEEEKQRKRRREEHEKQMKEHKELMERLKKEQEEQDRLERERREEERKKEMERQEQLRKIEEERLRQLELLKKQKEEEEKERLRKIEEQKELERLEQERIELERLEMEQWRLHEEEEDQLQKMAKQEQEETIQEIKSEGKISIVQEPEEEILLQKSPRTQQFKRKTPIKKSPNKQSPNKQSPKVDKEPQNEKPEEQIITETPKKTKSKSKKGKKIIKEETEKDEPNIVTMPEIVLNTVENEKKEPEVQPKKEKSDNKKLSSIKKEKVKWTSNDGKVFIQLENGDWKDEKGRIFMKQSNGSFMTMDGVFWSGPSMQKGKFSLIKGSKSLEERGQRWINDEDKIYTSLGNGNWADEDGITYLLNEDGKYYSEDKTICWMGPNGLGFFEKVNKQKTIVANGKTFKLNKKGQYVSNEPNSKIESFTAEDGTQFQKLNDNTFIGSDGKIYKTNENGDLVNKAGKIYSNKLKPPPVEKSIDTQDNSNQNHATIDNPQSNTNQTHIENNQSKANQDPTENNQSNVHQNTIENDQSNANQSNFDKQPNINSNENQGKSSSINQSNANENQVDCLNVIDQQSNIPYNSNENGIDSIETKSVDEEHPSLTVDCFKEGEKFCGPDGKIYTKTGENTFQDNDGQIYILNSDGKYITENGIELPLLNEDVFWVEPDGSVYTPIENETKWMKHDGEIFEPNSQLNLIENPKLHSDNPMTSANEQNAPNTNQEIENTQIESTNNDSTASSQMNSASSSKLRNTPTEQDYPSNDDNPTKWVSSKGSTWTGPNTKKGKFGGNKIKKADVQWVTNEGVVYVPTNKQKSQWTNSKSQKFVKTDPHEESFVCTNDSKLVWEGPIDGKGHWVSGNGKVIDSDKGVWISPNKKVYTAVKTGYVHNDTGTLFKPDLNESNEQVNVLVSKDDEKLHLGQKNGQFFTPQGEIYTSLEDDGSRWIDNNGEVYSHHQETEYLTSNATLQKWRGPPFLKPMFSTNPNNTFHVKYPPPIRYQKSEVKITTVDVMIGKKRSPSPLYVVPPLKYPPVLHSKYKPFRYRPRTPPNLKTDTYLYNKLNKTTSGRRQLILPETIPPNVIVDHREVIRLIEEDGQKQLIPLLRRIASTNRTNTLISNYLNTIDMRKMMENQNQTETTEIEKVQQDDQSIDSFKGKINVQCNFELEPLPPTPISDMSYKFYDDFYERQTKSARSFLTSRNLSVNKETPRLDNVFDMRTSKRHDDRLRAMSVHDVNPDWELENSFVIQRVNKPKLVIPQSSSSKKFRKGKK